VLSVWGGSGKGYFLLGRKNTIRSALCRATQQWLQGKGVFQTWSSMDRGVGLPWKGQILGWSYRSNVKGICEEPIMGWPRARGSHFSLEKGALFHSFRIYKNSFHDLPRAKPSSLFMLLGWRMISIASLMIFSTCPDLIFRILVSWNWIWWPRFILCLASADLSKWYSLMCQCTPWSWHQWNASFYSNLDLTTFMAVAVNICHFQTKVFLDSWEKTFLSRRPTVFMLCLLAYCWCDWRLVQQRGKKDIDVSSFLGVSSLQSVLTACWINLSL